MSALALAEASALLLVDTQPSFLSAIHEADRVLRSSLFLAQCAHRLGVPVFATAQNPDRMGGLDGSLVPLLSAPPIPKLRFSSYGAGPILNELASKGVDTVVIAGIETPICVTQTAIEFVEGGYVAMVAADAVGARSAWAHEAALTRLGASGVTVTQADSVVYEWMRTAEHEAFKDVLSLVKSRP